MGSNLDELSTLGIVGCPQLLALAIIWFVQGLTLETLVGIVPALTLVRLEAKNQNKRDSRSIC